MLYIIADSAIDFVKLMINAMEAFQCVNQSITNHLVHKKLTKLLPIKLDRS